ncbi:MAG: undecaprenyldiphospho-muramoylpentapeptide beta-N-acetylglucosaminyltransferase [Bacillota bacterium]
MRIVISGGGTGGHIYPAISILEEFDENNEILYIGSENSMESRVIPKLDYTFESIKIEGFDRKNKFKNIFIIFKLVLAIIKSLIILISFKPDVVIGTGGYVSGPVLFSASILKKKTYIHEQNSFPGLTNKILSKFVNKIFVSYEESINNFDKNKVIYTGNPIRKEFKMELKKSDKINKKDNIEILSFGGSGGAKKINEIIYELIKEINGNKKFRLIHATGKKYFNDFEKEINKEIDLKENIVIKDYIDNMAKSMKNADIVIARAGAITISELKFTQTPSILIPSPNVSNDHQKYNALALQDLGVSKMILEKDITVKLLIDILKNVPKIKKMKNNFENVKKIDSAKKIVKEIRKDL